MGNKRKAKRQIKMLNRRRQTKHRQALEDIADNPELIGIKNSREIIIEMPIFRGKNHTGNNLICEPDLIISDKRYVNYLIEYKCKDSISQRIKAKKQLLIAKEALKNMNIPIHHMFYVYSQFVVEEYDNGWHMLI